MNFRKAKEIDRIRFYYRGYTLTLKHLSKEDEKKLKRAVELYRFVYNWSLDTIEEYYHKYHKHIDDKELQRLLRKFRNENEWLQELGSSTCINAMCDALDAYIKFFKKQCKHPKYKSKKRSKKQFSPRSDVDRFYINDNILKIENIGKLDLGYHTNYRYSDHIKYSDPRVFLGTDGKWKVSFCILTTKVVSTNFDNLYEKYTPSYGRPIGIDLNKINYIATSYMNGEIYKLPDTVEKYYNKANESQKAVTRDVKLTFKRHPEITNLEDYDLSEYKSNNAIKRQRKAAKYRRKVHNIINTYTHTIAKKIITRYPKAIIMENLNTKSWYKNHNQAKGISYIPFYETRIIFQKKCDKYNVPFILARKDYPSTQRCSYCGNMKKMSSTSHIYRCPVCGNIQDRDINAAFNLESYYNYVDDALVWE